MNDNFRGEELGNFHQYFTEAEEICIACNSSGPYLWALSGSFKAVKCINCNLIWMNPYSSKKGLDLYYKKGFTKIEAKAGVHSGTFKVFVNFIPVADITFLVPELYKKIAKTAVNINGIYYTPPNYLRMLMYLELSRPKGDPSRWEKVLKRISLLNKNYPLKGKYCLFFSLW